MATFCLVVAPLPYTFRKRLFTFLSESRFVAKVAYGLKITFMYVTILFFYCRHDPVVDLWVCYL